MYNQYRIIISDEGAKEGLIIFNKNNPKYGKV